MSPEVKHEEKPSLIHTVRSCEGARLARTLIGSMRYKAAENSLDANMLVVAGINTLPGGKDKYVVFELPLPVGNERSNLVKGSQLGSDDELLEHLAIGVQAMWNELPIETKVPSRALSILTLNTEMVDYSDLIARARAYKEKTAAKKALEEAERAAQEEVLPSQES